MNKIVVIVAGNSGAGKDCLINMFREMEPSCNRFSITDFAIPIAREMGWDGERDEKGRELLADIIDIGLKYSNKPLMSLAHKCAFDRAKFTFVILKSPKDISLYKEVHSALYSKIKIASCIVYKDPAIVSIENTEKKLPIDCIDYNLHLDLFDFKISSSQFVTLRAKLLELMESNNG